MGRDTGWWTEEQDFVFQSKDHEIHQNSAIQISHYFHFESSSSQHQTLNYQHLLYQNSIFVPYLVPQNLTVCTILQDQKLTKNETRVFIHKAVKEGVFESFFYQQEKKEKDAVDALYEEIFLDAFISSD